MDNWVVLEWESLSREELLAHVASQQRAIASQQQAISELQALVEAQERRIAELERRLSRNSGNSSMPPSTDDLPGRSAPQDKPAGGGRAGRKRRRGKQPGAPGAHLVWRERPDDTIGHYPTGECACGKDLAAAIELGVAASHQVHDIPLVTATVTQHDLHRVRCGCGAQHVAPRPQGVAASPTSYGANLQALCVYLMVAHAVPVQRCAQLVESITGAAPSVGFVHGMLTRAAAALVEVDKRIRALITLAYAVCADETPLRVGRRRAKRYLLVAATELYTYYQLGDRSLASFKAFVLPQLSGVVVHDRYQNYDSGQLGELVHQLCTAHLLRDLADVAESYPGEVWPTQIAEAIRGLIHEANTARAAGRDAIDARVKAELVDRYKHGVLVGLKNIPRIGGTRDKQLNFRNLLEVLHNRRADVLRFANDLNVPPTSNHAERAVRPARVTAKSVHAGHP